MIEQPIAFLIREKEEKNRFKNIFFFGYTLDKITKKNYKEWDLGDDFYAPQSFVDSKGRRILLGQAGLDDNKLEYEYPVFNENVRHSLTLPRELKLINDRIYQYPIKEILDLFDSSNISNSYDIDIKNVHLFNDVSITEFNINNGEYALLLDYLVIIEALMLMKRLNIRCLRRNYEKNYFNRRSFN